MLEIPDSEGEEYSFLRLYSIDFDMAKQACDLLATQSAPTLQYCILRDIVVSYARPFSGNRGTFLKSHRLPVALVPLSMRGLHEELATLRDQVFAHTDQDFRRPQLARIDRSDGSGWYPMGFRNPSYESLLARTAEIRTMIVALEDLVNGEVRSREKGFDALNDVQNRAE
jgi:hypothetical protein